MRVRLPLVRHSCIVVSRENSNGRNMFQCSPGSTDHYSSGKMLHLRGGDYDAPSHRAGLVLQFEHPFWEWDFAGRR
jgi:hypothetical protein